MSRKVIIVLLVFAALALSLSGCVLSASKAPTVAPTSNIPFPTPLPNDAIKNAASGTQTAIAMATPATLPGGEATATQGQAPETAATNTSEPVVVVPTQAPVVVVPTATPGLPSTYTIQKGEWPYCIARRFNIDIAALLNANGLNANSRPPIGTVLTIPQSAGAWNSGNRALKTHPTTYTVASGDTVNSIACDFGDVDPNAIIAANNLASPYTLTPGQTISIP